MGNSQTYQLYSKTFKKNTVEPDSSSTEPFRSIACLFARVPDGASDYFFSTLAKNIEQEAFRHNYILKYTFSAFDIDDPFTLQLIASNDIDGIAVLGRCDKELLKFLKKHFQYVVYSGLNNLDANMIRLSVMEHKSVMMS